MTREELLKQIGETFNSCMSLLKAKNTDYASDEDALRNFRACEGLGICNLETGIVVRLSDKFSRIARLMSHAPAVADESIDDTILDAINYLAILRSARHARTQDPR